MRKRRCQLIWGTSKFDVEMTFYAEKVQQSFGLPDWIMWIGLSQTDKKPHALTGKLCFHYSTLCKRAAFHLILEKAVCFPPGG